VAVVGGGITGLATAWYLRNGTSSTGGRSTDGRPDVTLLEECGRLGGKIRTEDLGGVPVEAGPDTFLARVPRATELCHELGLGDDLVPPATAKAYVWHAGRLHPLPTGTVLGVPVTAQTLASSLLSPAGAARAFLDLVLPRRPLPTDPSVAEVVGGRLGREVLERLVEPLVGGINAGRADRLSLASTAPRLAEAAVDRSLVLGLRRRQATDPAAQSAPVFLGVRGGMQRLVDRLTTSLDGVDVRTGAAVQELSAAEGGGWRLDGGIDPAVTADAVVITVPPSAAAPLLSAAPGAAAELRRIRHASVVVATLAYRPDAVPLRLDGSGFLVPRSEGRLLTACTWSTSKWPALDASGLVILRASTGRDGDERALGLDDATVVETVHGELGEMVGVTERPVTSRVDRWLRAFPQYEPGHDERVRRIETALASTLPGVLVAGSAYRGLGIAACVQQGYDAARRVLGFLGGGNMGRNAQLPRQ